MFSATKLRRGMIPKDKEGNAEPWAMGEKPCVTTTLIILLLVGARKNTIPTLPTDNY